MSEITQAVGAPLERQVRPERVDWHGHGLSWAAADAFEGGSDWTADDVARAFAAGAKAALTQAASVHARNATSTADVLDLRPVLDCTGFIFWLFQL